MNQPAQVITEPSPVPVATNVQPSPKEKKGLLIILLVILGLIVIGAAVYAGMQIGKKQSQTYVSPTPVPTEVLIPIITLIPTEAEIPTSILFTPTPDPTADWKTYSNNGVDFKYPSGWKDDGYFITSTSPRIKIYAVSKANSLMNECMREISTETRGSVAIRKFERVTSGEMCSTLDSTPREMWIVPSATAFSPGISYQYSSTEEQQAEAIFNTLLTTIKFLP